MPHGLEVSHPSLVHSPSNPEADFKPNSRPGLDHLNQVQISRTMQSPHRQKSTSEVLLCEASTFWVVRCSAKSDT